MVTYRIELSTDGKDWTTVINGRNIMDTVVMDSIDMTIGFKFGELHEKNTFSFSVDSDWATSNALSAIKYAKLFKDNKLVFVGLADEQNASVTIVSADFYETSLKFTDLSTLWENKEFPKVEVDENDHTKTQDPEIVLMIMESDGYVLSDPSNTSRSIMHRLFALMTEAIDSPMQINLDCRFTDTNPVKCFIAKGGDNIQEIFGNFLTQNGLTYWMDCTTLHIIDMLAERTVGTEIHDIETEATIERKNWLDTRLARVSVADYLVHENDICGKAYPQNTQTRIKARSHWSDEGFTITLDGELSSDTCIALAYLDTKAKIVGASPKVRLSSDCKKIGWNKWIVNVYNEADLLSHSFDNVYIMGKAIYKQYNELPTDAYEAEYNLQLDVEKLDYVYSTEGASRYLKAKAIGYSYEKEEWSFYANEDMGIGDICTVRGINCGSLIITHRQDTNDSFGGYVYTASPFKADYPIEYVSQYVPPAPPKQASNVNLHIVADRNMFLYDTDDKPIIKDSVRCHILMDFVSPETAPFVSLGNRELNPTLLQQTDEEEEEQYIGYYYVDISPTMAHNIAGSDLELYVSWNERSASMTFYKSYELVSENDIAITPTESKVKGIEVTTETDENGEEVPSIRLDGNYVINGSLNADKIDVNSLGTKKLHITSGGAIYAGGYNDQGVNNSNTKGLYISYEGDVKATKLQAYDINIQSTDSSGKTILSTFVASGSVETKSVSVSPDSYMMSDVFGYQPPTDTEISSTVFGKTYTNIAYPSTSGYKRINLPSFEFKVTKNEETESDWQYVWFYSDSARMGNHINQYGFANGGFEGRVTLNFRTSSETYKEANIYLQKSEDGGASWSSTYVGDASSSGGGVFGSIDSPKSWSVSAIVTKQSIIRLALYSHYSSAWWETGSAFEDSYYDSDGDLVGTSLVKRGVTKIVAGSQSIIFEKQMTAGYYNLFNLSENVALVNPSAITNGSNKTIVGSRSSDSYLRYTLADRIIASFGTFTYNNRVDNGRYTALGNIGRAFTMLSVDREKVAIDGTVFSRGNYVYIPNGFSCSFKTVIKESGIEASAVYSESSYMDNFIGMVAYFYGVKAPKGWLIMNAGLMIYRESNPKLYAYLMEARTLNLSNDVNATYNERDDCFVLPDLSAYGGRSHGRYIVGGNTSQVGAVFDSQNRSHTHSLDTNTYGGWGSGSTDKGKFRADGNSPKTMWAFALNPEGGDEARPASIMMLPCIYAGE